VVKSFLEMEILQRCKHMHAVVSGPCNWLAEGSLLLPDSELTRSYVGSFSISSSALSVIVLDSAPPRIHSVCDVKP
jgi:hypothetical protein